MEKKQEVYALEVLRETLQRFYDAVYPFDEAIGCRDLPTLAPNDIDSLRFSMDDFTDATPDFGNVCDAAVQLLAIGNREAMRRRLAELKGAIIDFGRAHTAMIDAIGKTEYAARCGEANAAYERIRDLAEVTLGVVDGLLASCRGEQVAATPSVTFEEVAQGVTKRVIVNGMTDTARAQEQAAQTLANWNAPQGGAQVAPQIATQGKKPHFNMGVGAVELYKAGMEWLERPNNQGKSADDAVRWLVSDACINHRKFRVRVLMKGRKWPDKETEGIYADTVNWDRHGLDVERWGGYLGNYMKWRKDEKAHKALANQSATALPPPPLQIENKSPIRNKKTLKRVGKRRGK